MGRTFHATVVALTCIFAFLLPARSIAQSYPPVQAFGQLPFIKSAQLSPDGKHFLAVQSLDGKPVVAIYEVGGAANAKPVVIPSTDWLIRSAQWVKNDRIVINVTQSKRLLETGPKLHTYERAMSVGIDGSDPVALLAHNPNLNFNLGTGWIVDRDLGDPDNVFMPFWSFADVRVSADVTRHSGLDDDDYADLYVNELYKINVHTGEGSRVADGGHYTYGWYMDGNGQIVARVDETTHPLVDHLMLFRDGDWKQVGAFDAEADKGADVEGLSQDGRSLVRFGRDSDSMRTLMQMDISSGTVSTLFENPSFDVGGAIGDDWTHRVVGAWYEADSPTIVYFDPKREALQKGLEQAFPGLNVSAVSLDIAQDKVIVAVEGPRNPTFYYYLDRTTHQALPIASAYPGLSADDLGEMRPYPYKARDGLMIPAYLTLPPGRVARNLPAVVFPHGGPDSRDSIGFDWWAQFYANRGYIVFQPNYRGSTGYGHKFTEAGLHQWGLRMQDDITDGVQKMIADGLVDPKRVCIVGASYGGYAALAGAAFTPNLYACAVSVAGVSDLPSMIREERTRYGKDSSDLSFWISRIGSPDDDSEQLRKTSPALHADQIKCPVLLMHGDGDTTVPIRQTQEMYDAMTSAGKNVRFVTLEGDDHYLALAESRIRILSETESFLAQNIGSAAARK